MLLQVVLRRIDLVDGPVVIEDIRFPAEVEFCRSIGALTIRLEIPVETQMERLYERDGKTESEAAMLIECVDEYDLPPSIEWDLNVPAIGDFKVLAKRLHSTAQASLNLQQSLLGNYQPESHNTGVKA